MGHAGRVIALGFFDGVHIGHAALLRRTAAVAAQAGVISAAVTFDIHPQRQISGAATPLLGTVDDRRCLMQRLYHIDEVITVPFDDAMMHMDWRDFVADWLVAGHGAVHVVAGHDFRFGFQGQGNADRLRTLCQSLGVGCDIVPPVTLDGIAVSSSYIRTLIAGGEMARAVAFLGHPHLLSGPVVHGRQLGRQLGFPTANLALAAGVLVPAFGVYAGRVTTGDGGDHPAAISIGLRPTVDDGRGVTVEAHLLDFSGDLYGQKVCALLHTRLRGELTFASTDALAEQMARDVAQVRQFFQ